MATSYADTSAQAIIRSTLDQYGLGSLADTLWGWYQEGRPMTQIFTEMRTLPEYKARFPAMESLAQQGRAISEAEYINYEKTVVSMFRAYGLPPGFYDDPSDFTNFLVNQVSPAELSQRVEQGYAAALAAPAEVRDELARLYGVGEGGLAAFFLDPDRALPALQRTFVAAQASGAAVRTGFGGLSTAEAERLAALGVDAQRAEQGFGSLVESSELFGSLPGEGADDIGRAEQLGAAFGGDTEAQRKIRKRAKERTSVFQQGGAFAGDREGFSGLGEAQ